MNTILARLERRLGKYAVAHFTLFIVGGMAVVFVLSMLKPSFITMLQLDLAKVKEGEVWRLFTYLFLPESKSPFWILIALYWVWMIGTNLENEWGAFKFNVYYLLGMVGTTIAAAITGNAVGNTWLNMSLFLAFATVFPNYEIFLFFVLRIKVKWLGILAAGLLVFELATGSWATRGAVLAASINYLLFFTGHLYALARSREAGSRDGGSRDGLGRARSHAGTVVASGGGGRSVVKSSGARVTTQELHHAATSPTGGQRVCAICGAREDEDEADIRVCSCEKCVAAAGSARMLCLPHAREH
jgi:membrane associated rhomboid family serine protease